ncbi:MAG: ATP-binding protein [Anaerolineales bacterium]|nr:ATP-binding protein [Anaerolineales bacterium]
MAGALATVHADKPVTLERDIAPGTVFHGDPEDLIELLGNLLDNAWKWSAAWVRLRALAQADGGLRIEIADDGPGLPADRRNAVLERGVRADERVPGEGIGLHLVRSMVEEAYGGTIALDEADLGGLRVIVTLPGPGPVGQRGRTRVGG